VPQRTPPSPPRIVVIRRRAPVNLQTAAGLGPQSGVHVYADGRPIAHVEAEPDLVPAVAGLLRGPAWLFLVAARLPMQIIARLWVLVPVQPPALGSGSRDLHDDDQVYAYPIADLVKPAEASEAADDLTAEAGRLLEIATTAGPLSG
jgi:hypothetical protein